MNLIVNPLRAWRLAQQPRMTLEALAAAVGAGGASTVRHWELPFDHPEFRRPGPTHMPRVTRLTGLSADVFFPPAPGPTAAGASETRAAESEVSVQPLAAA